MITGASFVAGLVWGIAIAALLVGLGVALAYLDHHQRADRIWEEIQQELQEEEQEIRPAGRATIPHRLSPN